MLKGREHPSETEGMRFTSLCLYTDGGGADLERALEKGRALFQEVCVVDLGEEGSALAAAASAGALGCRYRWSSQAAEALNTGIDLATGDWILLATAEEVLTLEAEELAAFLGDHGDAVGTAPRRRVGPLTLPTERGLPAGSRFSGRDVPVLEPVRTGAALPGFGLPAADELPFDGPVQRTPQPSRDASAQNTPPDDGSERSACERAYEKGLALYQEERHAEALEVLSQAIDQLEIEYPFSAHLLETACYCLRALERSEEALAMLDQVAGHFPDRVDTQFLLALLCFEREQFERAEVGFQRCLTLEHAVPVGGPSEPSRGTYVALHNLGALRETLDMADEAVEYYRRALAKNPFYVPSREALQRLEPEVAEKLG